MFTRPWHVMRCGVLTAGTIFCVLACRSNIEAGRAARGATICAEFCRLVVRSSDPTPNGECHRACMANWELAGNTCQQSVSESMRCDIDQASRDYPNLATSRCLRLKQRADACVRDCQQRGVIQSGEVPIVSHGAARSAQFQLRLRGCEACVPERGANAGAACSSSKVCEESCLDCRSGQSFASLRACVDGRCAGRAELSALANQLETLRGCVATP